MSAAAADRIGTLPLLQLAGAVVLLGSGWPVAKTAMMDGAAPSWFALGRAGFSMLIAFAAVAATGGLRLPARIDLPALLALGGLQLGAFFVFAHAAVASVPAGRTAVLSNTTIVWTVPIALLSGEAIGGRRWLAALVAAAGVVVLVGPWAIDWSSGAQLVGHAYLLCASLSWAIAMAVVRRWPPRMTMFQMLPWSFAVATAMLLPLALLHDPGHWSGAGLAAVLAIGLVMGPLGTWCIMQATTALPLVVASVGFLAGPAVGLLLSALVLNEPLTPAVLAGTGLILGGAALAAWSSR